jgi:hypothetical protein
MEDNMRIHIVNGNKKLGKISNVSLLPGLTCGNVPCKKDCYATKFLYRQSVKNAWTENTKLAMENMNEYFEQIKQYLNKKKSKYFRFHVAGDFPSQEYLNATIKLAREHPNTRFLAFTKKYSYHYRAIPDNYSIIFSVWPSFPYKKKGFPLAFMQDGTETRIPKNTVECPGNCEHCGMCWNLKKLNMNVVFHKH